MKRFFLSTAIALLSFLGSHAQGNFNAGIHLGIPIGNFGGDYTFNISLDTNYLWSISDTFDAGVATGYSHSFGSSYEFLDFEGKIEDLKFIPLAASVRFMISDKFTLGTDLGYAIGIGDDAEGGFYYAPKVQYAVTEPLDIVLAYRGVTFSYGIINVSYNVITLGVEYGF